MANTTYQIDPQKLLFSGGSPLGEGATSGVISGSSVTLNEFSVVTDICNKNQQKKFIITARSWTTAGRPFSIAAQIAQNQWTILTFLLKKGGAPTNEAQSWARMPIETFCHWLEKSNSSDASGLDVVIEIGKLKVKCNPDELNNNAGFTMLRESQEVTRRVQGDMELTTEEEQAILKLRMQGAFKNNEHQKMADKLRAAMLKYSCESIANFVTILMDAHKAVQDSIKEAKEVGFTYQKGANYASLNPKGQSGQKRKWEETTQPQAKSQRSTINASNETFVEHTLCGHKHAEGQCRVASHPDRNPTSSPFAESDKGRLYNTCRSNTENLPEQLRNKNGLLKDWKVDSSRNFLERMFPDNTNSGVKRSHLTSKGIPKNKQVLSPVQLINTLREKNNSVNEIFCRVTDKNTKLLRVLLDTGAVNGNYISEKATIILKNRKYMSACKCQEAMICSSFDKCISNNKCGNFKLNLFDFHRTAQCNVYITARIVAGLPYDIIIGLPSIRQYQLTNVFTKYFENTFDDSPICC